MARHVDISQTAEAQRLDAEAVRLHALYTVAAEAAAVAHKAAGRPQKNGYFDPKSPEYAAFQNALEDKEEAYPSLDARRFPPRPFFAPEVPRSLNSIASS